MNHVLTGKTKPQDTKSKSLIAVGIMQKPLNLAPFGSDNNFPFFIPLSADSQDILAYVSQALEARKPVGYQHEFLQTYHLNVSWFDELLALRKIEFADLWYFAWSQKNRACARFLKQESGSDPG